MYLYPIFGYLRNDVEPHPATNGTDLTNLLVLWCDNMGKQMGWINSKKKIVLFMYNILVVLCIWNV